MKKPKLSVIGLGKLGLCAAACFASRGYQVLGLDVNKRTVGLLNQGKTLLIEPKLQDLINQSKASLRATLSPKKVMRETDISFFVVPTPSNKEGTFSDSFLKKALGRLMPAFKDKKRYHLFVIVSTVSPGTIEKSLIPFIEKCSKKKLNQDFGLCYNPEFIALGSVIQDFLNPDMVLIGESHPRAGKILEKIYQNVCRNNPYIARMSIISAEVAKISLNSYITMKISFANTLGNLCERIPGTEIDKITKALGTDKRVSPYYLKAGPPYGGPCFPRDNRAFAAFARKYLYDAKLAKATDQVNRLQIQLLVKKITTFLAREKIKKVAILGLAYKTNTSVIEESAAVYLIRALLKKKIKITAYDPLAMNEAKKIFGKKIKYASLKKSIEASPVCIITIPLKEFQNPQMYNSEKNLRAIIDCWRILNPRNLDPRIQYLAVGKFGQ